MKNISHSLLCLTLFLGLNTCLYSQVLINEYSVSNLDEFVDNYGSYEDWIELYNTSSSYADLSGYYLSDDPEDSTKWQFPDGIGISGSGFLKIWVSGRDEVSGGHYHTNYRMSQTKDNPEYVVLSEPDGSIIQNFQLQKTQRDHSRGRTADGSGGWSIYTNPTPGASNSNSTPYADYTIKPVMSMAAGFYDGPITVEITTDEPDGEIHYTLDGSQPFMTSPVYEGPIEITSTTIVNARVYNEDPARLRSFIEFNTYFINEDHNMAVMSCSAEQLDNLLNGNSSLRPFGTFEYFNEEGERTTFGYGEFNEHGQDSWVHDQRSIDYITRDECGYNYAIRESLIPLTDRDEFQRIILRAAGDDNYPGIDTSAHLRDFFVQNIAEKSNMHLDVRKGEKGVLYVNGVYWGVYGYREKVNDHDFTSYYYDQGKYDIYFLMLWGGSWAEYGGQAAWDDWNALHDFIKFNDMSNQENFDYVKSKYDYKSLVDYIHINSFVVCSDWINWNVGWWKGTNPDGGHQKWGYVLWDEDATFAHYINYTGVPGISPYVSPCFPEGLNNDPEEHIVLLNRLIENDEFYQYYVTRYIDLYNTAFQPDYMINYLDSVEARMAPEMPAHTQRWGGTVGIWENNVQKIRNFVTNRHSYLPGGLSGCYDLDGPYDLSINIEPAGVGKVFFNSLELETLFTGAYFGGIDNRLLAVATDPQYEFDQWVLNNHSMLPSDTVPDVTLNLTSWDNIIALFKPKTFVDSLVINEINYNSANNFDTRDWIELYNPHEEALNIGNWVFKDDNDDHNFTIPEGTMIPSEGYLVIVRDSAAFNTFFPEVDNYMGEFDFGLSATGELLRLFDATGALVDTVHYSNAEPWPTAPDGTGPTLELLNPVLDNALPESWAADSQNGTPGAMNTTITKVEVDPINSVSFVIYPNPMTNGATLQVLSQKNITDVRLDIYNVFGTLVSSTTNIQDNRIQIERNNLPKGIYICKLYDLNNRNLGTKKLMVE
jgi:hypothetical protein